ncbi:type VI secretion system lipoprotein TssJ [Photobacterium sp.]|uniref:type VI secretion system lipoprotein TssJ n=1 Tax=Photobacterium sp. TaxID=660 RepID=UPI00299DFC31|nr:type VI secretion system lipoprotein TssJ [Photobacterium sp.]MDX1302272.1 type VI secretion system lipoprotein TssJ [Photobacterium sp.]
MKRLIPLLFCSLLFACSSTPDPTLVDLTLIATSDLNPDQTGRPSPMVVKIVELKAATGFENATFFDLYENTQKTLGPDFIAEEELILRPGEKHNMKLNLNENSRFIGIIGAYQQINDAEWRFLQTLEKEELQKVELGITDSGIFRIKRVSLRNKHGQSNNLQSQGEGS